MLAHLLQIDSSNRCLLLSQILSFDPSIFSPVYYPFTIDGLSECKLYCMIKGSRMFVELANKVKDGTPCGTKGTEACYSGQCQKVISPVGNIISLSS